MNLMRVMVIYKYQTLFHETTSHLHIGTATLSIKYLQISLKSFICILPAGKSEKTSQSDSVQNIR